MQVPFIANDHAAREDLAANDEETNLAIEPVARAKVHEFGQEMLLARVSPLCGLLCIAHDLQRNAAMLAHRPQETRPSKSRALRRLLDRYFISEAQGLWRYNSRYGLSDGSNTVAPNLRDVAGRIQK